MMPRLWSLQRWRLGRVIVVLVLTVVLLQLIHMMLLTRLEAHEGARRRSGSGSNKAGRAEGGGGAGVGRQLQGRTVKNVIAEMHERVKNSYRLVFRLYSQWSALMTLFSFVFCLFVFVSFFLALGFLGVCGCDAVIGGLAVIVYEAFLTLENAFMFACADAL